MRARQQGNIVQIILLALVAMGAMLASCRKLLPWVLHRTGADTPDMITAPYRLAILWPNYFENGFIRRGLGGTIKELIRRSGLIDPAAGYHILGAILLLIPLLLLLRRLAMRGGQIWLWFAALLVLSPQLFLGWGTDFGRSDMLCMGFVAWATLALVDRRYRLAVGLLLAGSLVHETALFYGTPLVAGFAWRDHRAGHVSLRQGLSLGVLLLGGLIVIALAQHLSSDSALDIARTILRHDPVEGQHAAFMTVAGLRSVTASLCISFSEPHGVIFIASCVVVLALYLAILLPGSRHGLALIAFVAFVPFAAMCLVAIDYGRWLMMAVMNGWLAAVAMRIRGWDAQPVTRGRLATAGLLLVALLVMKTPSVNYANDATHALADRLLGPALPAPAMLSRCDPGWRSVIGASDPVQQAR